MNPPLPPPVDQAARDRITSTGLRETLFVEAGAGTGKTSTLVARVVGLVTVEQVALRDLAAITFTEAAAAELRDRVRRAFEEGASSVTDPIRAARCADALADLDGAAISTLHAFAQRILSEHPLEVRIPPRVEVLDDVQSTLAFEARWRAGVAAWHAGDQHQPLVVRLESCGVPLSSDKRASLKDIAAVFNANWDRLEDLPAVPLGAPVRLDRRPLHAAIHEFLSWADGARCADPADKLLAHLRELAPELAAVRAVDPDDDDRLLRVLSGRRTWRAPRRGRAPSWDDIEAARAVAAAAEEAADALRDRAVDHVLGQWVGVLRDFTLDAAHDRRDAGALEFHDLLVLARRLLRTSPAARDALHRRYTRLLLDEFQDTDPIQIELAVLIASGSAAGRGSGAAADLGFDLGFDHGADAIDRPGAAGAIDWTTIVPPAGRVFVVGDPKQSIYRFRRADIALYQQARDVFGPAAHVALTQNFRTVTPVLDWVNAVFAHLMPEERVGQPAYAPLHAVRAPSAAEHRVRCFGPCHADDPLAAVLRTREAEDVAAILDTIRHDPDGHPVFDERTRTWRGARAADITVLIPSRQSLPMLEAALAARDVPYRLDTSTLVFDAPEIRDLLTIVAAVDDPADAIAVVGALRTSLLACADPELFAWVAVGGSWDHRLPAPVGAPAAVAEAMAALHGWHRAARWCEPATLLEQIVRTRDAYALALTERRPRDAWRRVRFLIDQARRFADVGAGHLREFLDWAALQAREGARVPEPLLPETDDDAVRVMTFHGAKGLEFPIVVLSGLTTRVNGRRGGPQVHWGPDGRPAVRLTTKASTQNFDVQHDFESEMDADEKLRLLYVGATRARDHLLVSTHRIAAHEATRATHAAHVHAAVMAADASTMWIDPIAAAPAPRPGSATVPVVGVDPVDAVGDAAGAAWAEARATLLARGAVRRVWSATALGAELRAGGGPAGSVEAPTAGERSNPVAAAELVEPDESSGAPAPAPRGRGGTAFGRAVHAVLQHATGLSSVDALASRAARDEALVDETDVSDATGATDAAATAAAEVAACARGVLASPTVAAALAAPRHWRELAIAAPLVAPTTAVPASVPGGVGSAASGAAVLEGFVDLLAELDGELVLVDHKTDRLDAGGLDAAVAHHAPQLAAYAAAIEAVTGRRVARAVLVFGSVRGPDGRRHAVEREVPELAATVQLVRSHLAARVAAADPASAAAGTEPATPAAVTSPGAPGTATENGH